MATLLRVKRKISTEPSEALVIASKKARNDTEVETVFKFVGTLKRKEEHTDQHIDSLVKKHRSNRIQWGKNPKIRNTDFKSANRNYKEKRLKFLNIHRNLPDDVDAECEELEEEEAAVSSTPLTTNGTSCSNETKNMYKLYDVHDEETDETKASMLNKVEDTITCNGVPLLSQKIEFRSEDIGFVYDLYMAGDGSFNPTAEKVLSIKECTLENDLVYPDNEGDSDCFDDDDDSNDEDNWRNDYPDEETDFGNNLDYYGDYDCIDEDDLLARVRDCDIASDEDCSEEEGDDDEYQSTTNAEGCRQYTADVMLDK